LFLKNVKEAQIQKLTNKIYVFLFGHYKLFGKQSNFAQLTTYDKDSLKYFGVSKDTIEKKFLSAIISEKYLIKNYVLVGYMKKIIYEYLETCFNGYYDSEIFNPFLTSAFLKIMIDEVKLSIAKKKTLRFNEFEQKYLKKIHLHQTFDCCINDNILSFYVDVFQKKD